MKSAHWMIPLLAATSVAVHAADRGRLLQLVKASRADIQLVGLFKEAVRATAKQLNEEQMTCFQDIPADAFQETAVDYLASVLGDADVDQGLAFYATPLGRKWAARMKPDRGQPPPIELSEREFAQQEAFSLTRAGHELLAPNGLLQSRQAKKRFDALFFAKARECGGFD